MAKRRKKARKKSPSKRVSLALTRFLKRMNPSKMRGVKVVRIKKLRGGGVSLTPVHGEAKPRRRRTKKRRR